MTTYESFYTYIQQLLPESKFNQEQIEPLLSYKKLSKGEFIFHEGDICQSVYFTVQGCLRSFVLKNGKEYTLFFHTENQTLGDYESFQKSTPACFSCQAIENSEILVFDRQAMNFFENTDRGQKLLRFIAEDLLLKI